MVAGRASGQSGSGVPAPIYMYVGRLVPALEQRAGNIKFGLRTFRASESALTVVDIHYSGFTIWPNTSTSTPFGTVWYGIVEFNVPLDTV